MKHARTKQGMTKRIQKRQIQTLLNNQKKKFSKTVGKQKAELVDETSLNLRHDVTHSQDSDDLYEAIMQEKREANQKLLKTELKEDSDISQETPPHPISPKGITKNAGPNSELKIYDSPDMFETFPSQDFDTDCEEEKTDVKWLGKPKSRLNVAPDCLLPLSDLKHSKNHTVLFDTNFFDVGPPPPSRPVYLDAWDSHHVRLPCSPKSLYPTPHGHAGDLSSRWELIEMGLYNDVTSSVKLEEAILRYNRFPRSFQALHAYFVEALNPSESKTFFIHTLPKMIDLALSLPRIITQPIPLLKKQHAQCLTLSQQQIACLLANAFFCTFPRRNSTNPNSEYSTYPSINFNRLFVGFKAKPKRDRPHMEKLKTIFHYFKRVTEEMPSGVVTFERKVALDFPVWNRSPCELCGLHICKNGLIEEDGKGMLQMDFANKYVGGGVLGSGLVQEEILFCISPELIVSRLFTEVLDDNECLIVTGAERFSAYSGYAETYKWEGNYVDTNSRDSWRRKLSCTVALDATPFSVVRTQYRPGNVRRELNKLFSGLQCELDPDYSPAIATGNWGCGAFGGDPILKALLQLMVAAVVGRDLCYFTFNDDNLMHTIHEMYEFIKMSRLHVGELWNVISKYNEKVAVLSTKQKKPIVENIYEFMRRLHRDYQVSTDEGDSSPEKTSEDW